jgi:hypothetical protein
MRLAVPAGVDLRVADPEVRGEIDDLEVAGQGGDDRLGGRVRERAENEIDRIEVDLGDARQDGQREVPQVGKHVGHALPRLAVGGEGGDPHAGVRGDQAHQFGAGVAAGAEDRDLVGSLHGVTSPLGGRRLKHREG